MDSLDLDYDNVFNDPAGPLQSEGQFNMLMEDTPLIPLEWLEASIKPSRNPCQVNSRVQSRKNWPEQAERMLREFMDSNDFLHYHATKEESNQKLNIITRNLRGLFIGSWKDPKYDDLLKYKIRNKMHRIRPQIEKARLDAFKTFKDDLETFKKALTKIPPQIHEEAFNAVIGHIGKEKAIKMLSCYGDGKGLG
ncbi:MAG: hypothetical protein Q9214_004810, partial [Letrouitia sp. 1 TL-2023]